MQDKLCENAQLREDERRCPHCGCINNVINDRCLECRKALSDREILKEISACDIELKSLTKRIGLVGNVLLFGRIALLISATGFTLTFSQNVDKKTLLFLAVFMAAAILIQGGLTTYKKWLQKNLLKKSENKILLYKRENGFEENGGPNVHVIKHNKD